MKKLTIDTFRKRPTLPCSYMHNVFRMCIKLFYNVYREVGLTTLNMLATGLLSATNSMLYSATCLWAVLTVLIIIRKSVICTYKYSGLSKYEWLKDLLKL